MITLANIRRSVYNLFKRVEGIEEFLFQFITDWADFKEEGIVANQIFPETWHKTGVLNNLIQDINADDTATTGKVYAATVSFNDLPLNMLQAKLKIEIKEDSGKVILFTLINNEISPYYWWGISSYSGEVVWKSFLTEHQDISGKANIADLATVATSGDYNDLINKPSALDGKSAYELAVDNGFEGTEQEWLTSLKGPQGIQGIQGIQGEKGDPFTYEDFTELQLEEIKTPIYNAVNDADARITVIELQEQNRVQEYAELKSDAIAATTNANNAATLANQKAQLAADNIALSEAATELATQKAGVAQDKADLAQQKAELADLKAILADQKATLADTKATEASRVNATISGTSITVTDRNGNVTTTDIKGDKGDQGIQGILGIQGIQGVQGPKGDTGDAFSIYNEYASVSLMDADALNVPVGKFVIINSNVNDPDNSKLYIRTNNTTDYPTGFKFLTDMSGAQGIQGPQGEQGIQGILGEQGPAGQDGADGADGQDGAPGQDGHSPVVTASKSGSTTTIYVDGTSIATIEDGLDGQDAVSPTLATVATSGSYNDLSNKPSIPSKTSDLTNDSNFIDGLVILSYGSSTWNDFINAYNKNKVVYCRASSNANPATGTQTRLAFMAFVSNATSPANVEFQYYRSVSSHSDNQQGDQVFVYKLTNSNVWSVEVREAYTKVVAGTGLSSSYSNGVITLTNSVSAQVQSDWNASSGMGLILNKPTLATVATSGSYNDLSDKPTIPTVPTNVSSFTNDAGYLTSHLSLTNYVQKSLTLGLLKNDGTVDTNTYLTSHQSLTNYVLKSSTSGLLKNDGTVDTNTYLTSHLDISGKANSADLAAVATSGSYNDLSNKPTIPTKITDLENDSALLQYISQDLYVDMGLPSGTLWAKKNIDVTQADGFAASEYQYGCSFFSWGNTDGHNPTSISSFSPYSFGSSLSGSPYASSEGAKISYPGSADLSHDAAHVNLGGPWREPTTEDFAELFDSNYTKFIDANGNDIASNVTDKRVTVNSVIGIRLKSKVNGNIIFFPCAGSGDGTSWFDRGSYGYYWSSSLHSATFGRSLHFYSGGVYPQYYLSRFYGFAVRPVIGIMVASNVAISGDYNDLTNKPTIPTVPSNETAASGGTTLSVVTTGEKYTWNNKANIWRGTQSQYDALSSYDNNTIYIIS